MGNSTTIPVVVATASGSSFDEIDDACKTAKNPDATQAEREKAAKVFTDMRSEERRVGKECRL